VSHPPEGWPQPYPADAGPVPVGPHDRPRPYHQILLTRTYRPWRPALGLLVLGVTVAVAMTVVIVTTIVTDLVTSGDPVDVVLDRFVTEISPLALLGTNLSLAVAIPASMLALLVAHRLRPGWLGSVVGRLRWGLMLRLAGLALVVMAVSIAVSLFLPSETGDVGEVETVSFSRWLAFAAVVVLTTPLQAAGEEYAFRGYAFQALGAWFRSPWPGAVVTSLLFALAHGGQNPWLFADRFAFGLIACWLVVRTGGLEAAIALHAAYNSVSFLLAAALDQVSDTLATSDIPWWYAAFDVARIAVFAWLAVRLADRREVAAVTRSG
jgi:uncharacterized protein